MTQHTYEFETTEGIDYLVVDEDDDFLYVYERYRNDGAGDYLKKE